MKPRRLVTVACFFWAACATSPRAGASADCLREFNESFEHFDAVSRHRHLEGLQRADMECLFAAAKTGEAFNESFLAGPSHTARLQRFIGINSLAVGRRFEKHFARLPSGEWYGYNASALGRALESPGFFHVRFDADGSAIFGYADDFVGDFERQGLTSMFLATPGLEIRAIADRQATLLANQQRILDALDEAGEPND